MITKKSILKKHINKATSAPSTGPAYPIETTRAESLLKRKTPINTVIK